MGIDNSVFADCTQIMTVGNGIECVKCKNGKYVKSNGQGCVESCASTESIR